MKQWLVEGIVSVMLLLETGQGATGGGQDNQLATKGTLLNVYGKPQIFAPQHSSPQKRT